MCVCVFLMIFFNEQSRRYIFHTNPLSHKVSLLWYQCILEITVPVGRALNTNKQLSNLNEIDEPNEGGQQGGPGVGGAHGMHGALGDWEGVP